MAILRESRRLPKIATCYRETDNGIELSVENIGVLQESFIPVAVSFCARRLVFLVEKSTIGLFSDKPNDQVKCQFAQQGGFQLFSSGTYLQYTRESKKFVSACNFSINRFSEASSNSGKTFFFVLTLLITSRPYFLTSAAFQYSFIRRHIFQALFWL